MLTPPISTMGSSVLLVPSTALLDFWMVLSVLPAQRVRGSLFVSKRFRIRIEKEFWIDSYELSQNNHHPTAGRFAVTAVQPAV